MQLHLARMLYFTQGGCIKTHLVSIYSCQEGALACLCLVLASSDPDLSMAGAAIRPPGSVKLGPSVSLLSLGVG